jgi:hypothetical protein
MWPLALHLQSMAVASTHVLHTKTGGRPYAEPPVPPGHHHDKSAAKHGAWIGHLYSAKSQVHERIFVAAVITLAITSCHRTLAIARSPSLLLAGGALIGIS